MAIKILTSNMLIGIILLGVSNALADNLNYVGKFIKGYAQIEVMESSPANNQLKVNISTTRANGKMCFFESEEVVELPSRILIARANGPVYNRETNKVETVTCEITLTYSDDMKILSAIVKNRDNCFYFCGISAALDVIKAKKTN